MPIFEGANPDSNQEDDNFQYFCEENPMFSGTQHGYVADVIGKTDETLTSMKALEETFRKSVNAVSLSHLRQGLNPDGSIAYEYDGIFYLEQEIYLNILSSKLKDSLAENMKNPEAKDFSLHYIGMD
jgi:hypothetical protein